VQLGSERAIVAYCPPHRLDQALGSLSMSEGSARRSELTGGDEHFPLGARNVFVLYFLDVMNEFVCLGSRSTDKQRQS
jgi:hypothetical protein